MLIKPDRRELQLATILRSLRGLKSLLVVLVGVQSLLVSSLILGIDVFVFVLVVVTRRESRAGLRNFFLHLRLKNFHWVIVIEPIARSDESSLLRNELVEILLFICLGFSSEGRHPQVESVHGSAHRVYEGWFVLVDEAIHFVGIFLDLLPLLNHFAVRILRPHLTPLSLAVISFVFIHSPKIDSFCVLKCLYLQAFLDTIRETLVVIRFFLIFLFSVLLRCLISHL